MRISSLPAGGWIRRLALGLIVLLPVFAPGARAQSPPAAQGAGDAGKETLPLALPSILIDSDPSGAVVTLSGPYVWVGQTPWRLDRDVRGVYQVDARLPGYEPWHREVVLGTGTGQKIRIKMDRRTAAKALGRSLLFPGWGQIYSGSTGKGIVFTSAWLLGLAGSAWTELAYQHRLDQFKSARSDFESRRSLGGDWDQAYRLVQKRSGRADQAYDRRTIAVGAAAAVYALAVLDLVFLGPKDGGLMAAGNPGGRTEEPSPGGHWDWSAGMVPAAFRAGLSYSWK